MAVRRVRRVVRKIDPWTVLKVSIMFWSIVMLSAVLGLVVAWSMLTNAGSLEKVADLIESVGGPAVAFDGAGYFRVVLFLAIVATLFLTGLTTLAAVVYNLISDVVGGIEFVVLEETLVAPVRAPEFAPRSAQLPPPKPPALPRRDRRLSELPTEESPIPG